MEVRPWPSRAAAQDLSKAERFALAGLMVDPPTRRIIAGDREELLEPRVMRVLVALDLARGKVLSRDDLIELCWDGVIVGDNAINRVISRLRAILAELTGDTVRLETITKVGFRLVSDSTKADGLATIPPPTASSVQSAEGVLSVDRRWLIAGGGAAALAAAAAIGWRFVPVHTPVPEAVRLVERGNALMRSARMGATPEAIKLFGQAVKVDPEYADGWGALSSSYRHALDGYGQGERRSYPQMVASAADRALALDADQADALIAKATIYPEYRNWLTQEKALRDLVQRFPDHWYANARLGILLREVGRFEDALGFVAKVPRIDVQLAPAWAGLITTYTLAGRFHEADAAFDAAMSKIAPHPVTWFARYASLLESRRFDEAADFARDSRTKPEEFPSELGDTYAALATALADDDKAEIAASLAYVKSNLDEPGYILRAAPLLAALGDFDTAMAAYWAYLFGGSVAGHDHAAPGPLDLRSTQSLFAPSWQPLRRSLRFLEILQRTGLEDYWKRSGSQPDFRRN